MMNAARNSLGNLAVVSQPLMNPGDVGVAAEKIEEYGNGSQQPGSAACSGHSSCLGAKGDRPEPCGASSSTLRFRGHS